MADSKTIDDGGPAFPTDHSDNCDYTAILGGMTLRDYFAAKAMPEVWAYSATFTRPVSEAAVIACGGDPLKIAALMRGAALQSFNSAMDTMIAAEAYRIADAMLTARKGASK